MEEFEIAYLRNLRHVRVALGPGLNVFAGRNAQGKTSLLEAVALLAPLPASEAKAALTALVTSVVDRVG